MQSSVAEQSLSLEQLRSFNELQRVSASPENAARLFTEFTTIDVSGLAPKVACPTLVLHAREDARVPYDRDKIIVGLQKACYKRPVSAAPAIMIRRRS